MTASRGAVKRCQNICIYFLTENPEENGVNGALEREREEGGEAKIGFAADLMTEAR